MNNHRKSGVWLPLLFSITMIIGMLLGYRMRDRMPGRDFFSVDKANPLQEVMELVKNKYVDEVAMQQLQDTAIAAILSKLDPHSVYISAEDVESANEDIAGNFFGIGVEFSIIDDTINIVHVIPEGPSAKAGIITGDKLLKANDSLLAGVKITGEKIRKLLRGAADTDVKVELIRAGVKKQITIKRGIVPVSSVDAAYMMNDSIGYIRLNKFSQVTYREFMQSLEKLKNAGLKQLIFDLRGNGGGVLDQAAEVADEFLSGDKLITYTEGKHFARKEYRCKRPGLFETGKLVVLVDEGTASASEIIIGALQDWDRATILGRRSFGKGLVQEQYDLSDGSALRLTIARYFTPVGRSIQRPYSNGEKAYYEEVSNRFHDGEVISMDSLRNDSTKLFKTQNGRTVFGGGGITPDVFVPLDTASNALLAAKLYYNGVLNDFAYKFVTSKPEAFTAFRSAKEFASGYLINNEQWTLLEELAAKDSLKISLNPASKEQIAMRMKAAIARQLWRNEGLYEVLNTIDPILKKALEIAGSSK